MSQTTSGDTTGLRHEQLEWLAKTFPQYVAPPRKKLDQTRIDGLESQMAIDRHGTGSEQDYKERRAGKILTGMEKATRENQQAQGGGPLSHAVSGHGKDTDQVSRAVHGRRSDQLDEDINKPVGEISLTGNTNGIEDTTTPSYTTVGKDPSNITGAFTSHKAMLDVVNEGFAQANMISQNAEQRRKSGVESGLDETRFVTDIAMQGESLGYNLQVEGATEQAKDMTLAQDEAQERFKKLTRTDGVEGAKVVLDPSYTTTQRQKTDKDGMKVFDETTHAPVMETVKQRTGWNLQTAYPSTEARGSGYAKPGDVTGGVHDTAQGVMIANEKAKPLREAATKAAKKLKDHDALIKGKENQIKELEASLDVGIPKGENEESLAEKVELTKQAIEKLDGEMDELQPPRDMFADADDPLPELDSEAKDKMAELVRQRALRVAEQEKFEIWLKAKKAEPDRLELIKSAKQEKNDLTEERPALALDATNTSDALDVAEIELAEAEKLHEAAQEKQRGPDQDDGPPESGKVLRVGAGYDPVKGEYVGDRPAKPDSMKGKDEEDDSLTAHHLYPWNKILTDLNAALKSNSQPALQKLFAFGKVKVDASFWVDLAKPPAQRSYAFSEVINKAAQAICWSEDNVFMGPLGSKRGDDPGEEVDTAFTKSGLPTPASALAELTEKRGGIGAVRPDVDPLAPKPVGKRDPDSRLAELFEKNVLEAQGEGGKARPYNPEEWSVNSKGKKVRRRVVPEADPVVKRAYQIANPLLGEMEGELLVGQEELQTATEQPTRPVHLLEDARDQLAEAAKRLSGSHGAELVKAVNAAILRQPDLKEQLEALKTERQEMLKTMQNLVTEMTTRLSARN